MQPLRKLVSDLAQDPSLGDHARLIDRLEAMDRLEALLFDASGSAAGAVPAEAALNQRARGIFLRMESINRDLYEEMRGQIRLGIRPVWPGLSLAVTGREGYDYLDALVSGVLQLDPGQTHIAALPAEMVPYQPTPARHIFDLVRITRLREDEVFVDLGSGLGHVPLMVNICTGARAIGIEIETAYVDCARRVAAALNLANVSFLQQDARLADLSTGTVFYLYTPFKGSILRAVLDALKQQAARRSIRICTYGPCTLTLAGERWLLGPEAPTTDRITEFRSEA